MTTEQLGTTKLNTGSSSNFDHTEAHEDRGEGPQSESKVSSWSSVLSECKSAVYCNIQQYSQSTVQMLDTWQPNVNC